MSNGSDEISSDESDDILINRGDDQIRPTALQSFRVSARSQATWNALLSSAKNRIHLPQSCLNLQGLLNGTPSIPQSQQLTEVIGSNFLFLEGFSTWELLRDEKPLARACDLERTKSSLPRKVCIGDGPPRTCKFSAEFCPDWPGFQPETNSGNYLSLFVLGWSYVFSARLIELRRQTMADKVSYTENMAQLAPANGSQQPGALGLEIRSDDFQEVRWWASILANDSGWQATLSRNNQKYFSPWEIHLNASESTFTLYYTAEAPTSACIFEPPSSEQAQHYMFNLARQLNIFDQLIAALAGALTLPTHNRFGAPVTLPRPAFRVRSPCSKNTELAYHNNLPAVTDIPHYMALSAISGLLPSCLFGGLWEPGVSCNLASEWLNPAFKEILPLFKQPHGSFYVICAMCERAPNVASLWLGAAMTGLLPRIFQVTKSFMPTIYPEATVWSRSPQSFMDPSNHNSIRIHRKGDHEEISREDEFRLLFLTDYTSDNYGNPPISPYAPFGRVNIQDTSIEVRLHLSCNHRLKYQSWSWRCRDGHAISDVGKSPKPDLSAPTSATSVLPFIWMSFGITCARLAKMQFIGIQTMRDSQLAGLILPFTLSVFCLAPWNIKMIVRKQAFQMFTWIKGTLLAASSMGGRSMKTDEHLDDRLSEIATRNLFSWTLFTEGIRLEEKCLWRHEWLSLLVDRDQRFESSDSDLSTEGSEEGNQRLERIQRWQEHVLAQG